MRNDAACSLWLPSGVPQQTAPLRLVGSSPVAHRAAFLRNTRHFGEGQGPLSQGQAVIEAVSVIVLCNDRVTHEFKFQVCYLQNEEIEDEFETQVPWGMKILVIRFQQTDIDAITVFFILNHVSRTCAFFHIKVCCTI